MSDIVDVAALAIGALQGAADLLRKEGYQRAAAAVTQRADDLLRALLDHQATRPFALPPHNGANG